MPRLLVPKLHLGTLPWAKFNFAGRKVPKCNLGTSAQIVAFAEAQRHLNEPGVRG